MFEPSIENNPMKIAIIGSGIAGLSASIRLRLKGYEVDVYEANEYPGGKLHAFSLGKYRFDGGPSLFTMPQYVEELFEQSGKVTEHYFNFEKVDEACTYFWEDKTVLSAKSDPQNFANEAARVLNYPASELMDYFDHIKNIYDHSASIFLRKSLHKSNTWLSKETLTALLKIRQYDLFKSMHHANMIRLGEPHLVQLFDRFATYNGSHPHKAPGILNVIPWLEHGFGTFFPKGGMEQIPKSLHRLAEELGVQFHFNSRVDQIILQNKKAIGVSVNGQEILAEKVVSNMDVFYTYRKLLLKSKAPEKILNQERSSSALVFYWGIKKEFKNLGLHNILFSERYKAEFDSIFNEGDIIDDPTVYINISSKLEKGDAPNGCENWFVMVNAPNHKNQDWNEISQRVKKAVIKKLNRILNTDIEPLIEEEKIWTPQGIEEDTLSHQGALYGNASNSQFAAFLRHPNFSSSIDNLFFCGGSVHPGGGIPLALLSGKITSEMI